jgi:hypothetical protein
MEKGRKRETREGSRSKGVRKKLLRGLRVEVRGGTEQEKGAKI